jgi:uncharacterized protein YfkK (UPF0435 family)/tetratricopeptide (TPR) repeat protein
MADVKRNPFWSLKSSDEFEFLCRDLLAKQENVKSATKMFKQGSKQFGGDLIGYLTNDVRIIVAQCKWYTDTRFGPQDIRDAVDKFVEDWDTFWVDMNVTEFVIYVSQNLSSKEQLKAISEKRSELLAVNVEFVVKELSLLENELADSREIVRKYLDRNSGTYWQQELCGLEIPNGAGSGFNTVLDYQIYNENLEQKSSLLSELVLKEIEDIRQTTRSGQWQKAIDDFTELKSSHFIHLNQQAKAEMLSLEIRISFPHRMDSAQARELLKQIHSYDRHFDAAYLDALVTSSESGFEAGLKLLDACHSTATLNLKLSFLINLGRFDEAAQIYEDHPNKLNFDTETKRLYSLILLGRGEFGAAEKLIAEVWNEHPEWEAIRIARGIIFYTSGLSAQPLSSVPVAVPQPQPWTLIKNDQPSLEKRRIAAEMFASVLMTESRDEKDRTALQIWQLACLADDPEKFAEASAFCEELLLESPLQPQILDWALVRGLSVDTEQIRVKCEKAVNRLPKTGEDYLNGSISLIRLALNNNKVFVAKRILSNIKTELAKIGEDDLTAYLNCQISIHEGKFELVEKKLSQKISEIDIRHKVQLDALINLYNQVQNRAIYRRLSSRLLKLYRKSFEPVYLIFYCQLCFDRWEWKEIIKFSDVLLNRVGTIDSLRLVITAYSRDKQPEKALEILEKHLELFPEGLLPTEIELIKIEALIASGNLKQAKKISAELFERDRSDGSFWALARTAQFSGDSSDLEKALANDASNLSLLKPSQKLQISKLLASANPDLARSIWLQTLPEVEEAFELIEFAFFLGNRVGQSGETDNLRSRMVAAAHRGKTKSLLLTIEEFMAFQEESRRESQEAENIYFEGQSPIHFFCESRNWGLTRIYHEIPTENAKTEDFREAFPVYVRHGKRRIDEDAVKAISQRRVIHLDLSSILLLQHLEMLDILENFVPVFISTHTIPQIDAEISNHIQLNFKRDSAIKTIIQSIDDDSSQTVKVTRQLSAEEKSEYLNFAEQVGETFLSLVLQAKDENALVVAQLPFIIDDAEPLKVPENLTQHIVDWRVILNRLLDYNSLPAESIPTARKLLAEGVEQNTAQQPAVKPGAKLYFSGQLETMFAEQNLFEDLTRVFQVFTVEEVFARLKTEAEEFNRNKQNQEWRNRLFGQIRDGIARDIYLGISIEKLNDPARPGNRLTDDYRVRSLLDVLSLQGSEDDLALIDDRWVSGYNTVNHNTPILTIYEFLIFLRNENLLTVDEFYAKLLKLKRENFRFLPTTKEEIAFHLNNIKPTGENFDKARFMRPPAINILRRYTASCFLDKQHLRIPGQHETADVEFGELEFIFRNQRAVTEAIGALWRDEIDLKNAEFKVNILLFDLYVPKSQIRHLLPDLPEHVHGTYHFAADYLELCLQGIHILGTEKIEENGREEVLLSFFSWVNSVYGERLFEDELFFEQVVKGLTLFLVQLSKMTDDHASLPVEYRDELIRLTQTAMRNKYRLFLNSLPDVLRNRLIEDASLKEVLGYTIDRTVRIGKIDFDEPELARQIANALNGGKAAIKALNFADIEYEINVVIEEISTPTVAFSRKGKSFNLSGPIVGVQLPTAQQRRDFIIEWRNKLDVSEMDFLILVDKIANSEAPFERIELYNEQARRSAMIGYEQIRAGDNLAGKTSDFSEFSLENLPNHFRLEPGAPAEAFAGRLRDSGNQLLKEEGLFETINRLSRLPVFLPAEVVGKFTELPVEERKELLGRFRERWHSPVNRIHLIDLALKSMPDDSETLEIVKEELARLSSSTISHMEFGIFGLLLIFVAEEFYTSPPTKSWSLPVRLSLMWGHAAELYNRFFPNGAIPDENTLREIRRGLSSTFLWWRRDVFCYETDYWRDSLHPSIFSQANFTAYSLGAVFNESPAELIEKLGVGEILMSSCLIEHDNQLHPNPYLFRDYSQRTNVVGSFLGAENVLLFSKLTPEESETNIFEIDSIHEQISMLIGKLADPATIDSEKEGDLEDIWKAVEIVSFGLPLEQKFHSRFHDAVENFDFKVLQDYPLSKTIDIIRLMVSQHELISEKSRLLIVEALKIMMVNLAEKHPDKPNRRFSVVKGESDINREPETLSLKIAEVCIWLSMVPNNPLETARRWNRLIFDLGKLWSGFHVWLEPLFFLIWRDFSIEQTQEIDKNILLSKTMR